MTPAIAVTTSSAPPAPPAAADVFGERLPLAERYAALLCGAGIERGLLGPREVPRIWERHLLNCAVVTELLPDGARVVDVGSGAGLPGLALAIRRPDLHVSLVEPMVRRATFLREAVEALGADATVVTGRAEDPQVRRQLVREAWVTARAVAPLPKLVGWCAPLLAPGGSLLAIKGRSAAAEVATFRPTAPVDRVDVVTCGADVLDEPTTVVRVRTARSARSRS